MANVADVWDDAGDDDYAQRDTSELDREWSKRRETHWNAGYREGLEVGKTETIQKGFDQGFQCGAASGFTCGQVTGALLTLKALESRAPQAATLLSSLSPIQDMFTPQGMPRLQQHVCDAVLHNLTANSQVTASPISQTEDYAMGQTAADAVGEKEGEHVVADLAKVAEGKDGSGQEDGVLEQLVKAKQEFVELGFAMDCVALGCTEPGGLDRSSRRLHAPPAW